MHFTQKQYTWNILKKDVFFEYIKWSHRKIIKLKKTFAVLIILIFCETNFTLSCIYLTMYFFMIILLKNYRFIQHIHGIILGPSSEFSGLYKSISCAISLGGVSHFALILSRECCLWFLLSQLRNFAGVFFVKNIGFWQLI